MTISIGTLADPYLTIDEQIGVQNDGSDDDITSLSLNATLTAFLDSLNEATATGFPQYAKETNFITSGTPVNDFSLVSSLTGTVYPATGTDSGIQDLDGNHIFLFAGSDNNVVYGRVGDGSTVDLTGEVAFAIVLNETKVNNVVTSADLWIVQYEPLQHDGTDLVDAADTLDLLDKVFVASSFTSTSTANFDSFAAVPSGQDDFAMIAPTGGNNATVDILVTGYTGTTAGSVNVSTAGLGTDSQSVSGGTSLRIDFVNDGDNSKADTPDEVHHTENIDYSTHVENVTSAGFKLPQVNPGSPNTVVSATISAYNVSGDAKGTAFVPDALANSGTSVNITSVTVKNAAGQTTTSGITVTGLGTGTVTVAGLKDDYSVAFTTASGMDRFTITNSSPPKNNNTPTFDVGGIVFTTTTVTVNDDAKELGSHILIEDDGPDLSASTPTVGDLLVDETDLSVDDTANFSTLFTPSYGADGAGSVGNYVLGVGANNATGLFETASGHEVFLFLEGANVVGREGTDSANAVGGDIVFVVSVDTAGVVKLDQRSALAHTVDGPTNPDHDDTLNIAGSNRITLTATATDKDGDTKTATTDITGAVAFKDDGPAGALTEDTIALIVDDDSVVGGPLGSASQPLAAFFDTPDFGTDGPLDADHDGVADAGAIVYALRLNGTTVDSGLDDVATGKNILLVQEGAAINGYVDSDGNGSIGGTETLKALSFTSDGTDVTLQLLRAIEHDNPNDADENPDDNAAPYSIETIAANKVLVDQTAYDGDGDSTVKSFDLGAISFFLDDGPTLDGGETDITDFTSGVKQGNFGFDIGADQTGGDLNQYLTVSMTGTVGTNAITGVSVLANATDSTPTLASYDVSFTYKPDPNNANLTANATGTLTFDGSVYSFALDAPLAGFSILTTSKTAFSQGFDAPGMNGGSKEIVDSRLTANGVTPEFWVQFTGDHVTGGSSAVPLTATGASGSATAFAAGDLFHAAQTSVSISGSANGVAGDTIQRGEVLDMDFYLQSPGNNTTLVPTNYANGIFLKFDGIGANEDLLMVLKLADPSAPGTILTTKTVIISAADIIKGQANVPAGFGVTLDNNDGLAILESNDYNFANDLNGTDDYVIVGMQLLSSTEGITGSGINLNSAVGDNGGSPSGLVAFDASMVDTDVIKISDIGFIREDGGTLGLNLDILVDVTDADGDSTDSTHLFVNPTAEQSLALIGTNALDWHYLV